MSKRKMDDDEWKIQKYLRKIRKIKNRVSRSPSYQDQEYQEYYPSDPDTREEHGGEMCSNQGDHINLDVPEEEEQKEEEQPLPQEEVDLSEVTLDNETLKALGKPIKEKQKYGPNINGDLAKLWSPILKNGLGDYKEKQQLLDKYLIPNNCQLLQAPKLNPEIVATITDTIKNRDKKIEEEQQQLGHGVTALNKALSLLATNTGERTMIINTLSEASQILSDLHHSQTQARKRLITPILDKKFLDLVKDTDRDDYLYGNDLSEKIKALKYAQKSSHSIKKYSEAVKYFKKPTYNNYNNQTNYKGSPRYQHQKPYNRGGQKRQSDRSFQFKPNYRQTKKLKPEGKPARK